MKSSFFCFSVLVYRVRAFTLFPEIPRRVTFDKVGPSEEIKVVCEHYCHSDVSFNDNKRKKLSFIMTQSYGHNNNLNGWPKNKNFHCIFHSELNKIISVGNILDFYSTLDKKNQTKQKTAAPKSNRL